MNFEYITIIRMPGFKETLEVDTVTVVNSTSWQRTHVTQGQRSRSHCCI